MIEGESATTETRFTRPRGRGRQLGARWKINFIGRAQSSGCKEVESLAIASRTYLLHAIFTAPRARGHPNRSSARMCLLRCLMQIEHRALAGFEPADCAAWAQA